MQHTVKDPALDLRDDGDLWEYYVDVGVANTLLGTDLLPDLEEATKKKGWGK